MPTTEHKTPENECLQRIHDISIGYDGNANSDCTKGSMESLCKLIDEIRRYAETGLSGAWPDFIENDGTYWMIERRSLDGNPEWFCAGWNNWTKNANKAIHFPNNKSAEDFILLLKMRTGEYEYSARTTEHKNL